MWLLEGLGEEVHVKSVAHCLKHSTETSYYFYQQHSRPPQGRSVKCLAILTAFFPHSKSNTYLLICCNIYMCDEDQDFISLTILSPEPRTLPGNSELSLTGNLLN